MPPLSGFIGKLLLLTAAGVEGKGPVLWVIVLAGSLATLMALSRSGSTFFWRTGNRIAQAPAADKGALLAVIGLLVCILVLSLGAARVLGYTQALAQQLLAPQAYGQAMQQFRIKEGN
jgi:multicomponent K+:H+ antiporter subunit D